MRGGLSLNTREFVLKATLAQYIGLPCKFCGKTFDSLEELESRDAVWTGDSNMVSIACKECWEKVKK